MPLTPTPKLNGGHVVVGAPPGSSDADETAKQAHWFIALFRQGGALIILLIGLVFAAGKVTGKIDAVVEKQEEHSKALERFIAAREKVDERVNARFDRLETANTASLVWQAHIEGKIDQVLANAFVSYQTNPIAPPRLKKSAQKKPQASSWFTGPGH